MSQQTIGQLLSSSRQANQASLYQAAQDTKIRIDFLEAMERDDFEFVSGGPYVRGMLRSYTRWLGLPETQVLAEFDRLYQVRKPAPLAEMINQPADIGPSKRRPQWLIAAASAAGLLILFSIIGLINPSREDSELPDDTLAVEEPEPTDVATGFDGPESEAPAGGAGDGFTEGQTGSVEGVNLVVHVGERVWMQAHVDDEEPAAHTGILEEGEELVLSGEESVRIRIGNLAAVEVTFNGQSLGTPGAGGQVATFLFTPESAGFEEV